MLNKSFKKPFRIWLAIILALSILVPYSQDIVNASEIYLNESNNTSIVENSSTLVQTGVQGYGLYVGIAISAIVLLAVLLIIRKLKK